ncbi:hypothetical protein ABZY42_17655 [Streptomyces sp. NPDC006622]|uniref:hypothetical protein n=1 Tax=Streptomyces sp. NPDC006622 TaxID=3155459 RepID=UPI0033B2474A
MCRCGETGCEALPLNVFALMGNEHNIAGSQFAGIRENQEMLDFCAGHRSVSQRVGNREVPAGHR